MGIFSGIGSAIGKIGGGFLSGGPLGAVMGGASLLGGYLNQQGQNAALAEQQRRQEELQRLIKGQLQQDPSAWERQTQSFLGQMAPAAAFQMPTTSPGQVASQDALMQFLNRDPAAQLGQAGTTLSDLAATGGASNVDSLIKSIQGVQQQDLGNQVAGLRGRATSLGQRFGSALGKNEAMLRTQTGVNNTATLANVLNQNNEANLGRRLQASGALGGLLQQGQAQRLGAAGQLSQMGQFQQNLGLQGQQLTAQNLRDYMQAQLSGLQLGGSLYGQRQGQNAGLLGLLGGMPAPQAGNVNPLMGGLQEGLLSPYIFQQIQDLNKKRT